MKSLVLTSSTNGGLKQCEMIWLDLFSHVNKEVFDGMSSYVLLCVLMAMHRASNHSLEKSMQYAFCKIGVMQNGKCDSFL